MNQNLRVVHYLNQFFAGLGGEERSQEPPVWHAGPIGPGLLVEAALSDRGKIIGTIVCGDNYFCENQSEALAKIIDMIRTADADAAVAGPAFNAGRYGLACVALCAQVEQQLQIPAVSALYEENPAVAVGKRHHLWMAKTEATALGMKQAASSLAHLTWRVAAGAAIGPSKDEHYIARGYRRNTLSESTGAVRAVGLLLKKLHGEPWRTELPLPDYDSVPAPAPIVDLSATTVAMVTESGVVPAGNPDGLESWRGTSWFKYSIDGLFDLTSKTHQTVHGGYENTYVNDDPDRAVPVDALRALEKNGAIGKLFPYYYVATGMATTVADSQRIGREIAGDLSASGVTAVVLTAT